MAKHKRHAPAKVQYLYGKKACLERLRARPQTIHRIYLLDSFRDHALESMIAAQPVPVERVTEKRLLQIKRADRLQGVVAQVDAFTYVPFKELLEPSLPRRTLLLLDGINDPHNLGSILRIAACFGGFAVVIPEHRSCEVTETVLHVASGGENYVPVAMVTNTTQAAIWAKESGYWIAGTVVDGGTNLSTTALPFPLCIVLGSEGKGIGHSVANQLDLRLTIPMRGASLSFNVAMACAVLCYETARQRS